MKRSWRANKNNADKRKLLIAALCFFPLAFGCERERHQPEADRKPQIEQGQQKHKALFALFQETKLALAKGDAETVIANTTGNFRKRLVKSQRQALKEAAKNRIAQEFIEQELGKPYKELIAMDDKQLLEQIVVSGRATDKEMAKIEAKIKKITLVKHRVEGDTAILIFSDDVGREGVAVLKKEDEAWKLDAMP